MSAVQKRVVIADDHPLMLKGLQDCLVEAGYEVVAAVKTGTEALAALQIHAPCLSVLDISMPGLSGLEVAVRARDSHLNVVIVLLSIYDNPAYVHKAKSIPVDGYLLKEKATQDVVRALEQILSGQPYFDYGVETTYHLNVQPIARKFYSLSPSEQKILLAISKGRTVKEIAGNFFISVRTVEKHRENIRRKLDLGTDVARKLNQWARENAKLLRSFDRFREPNSNKDE